MKQGYEKFCELRDFRAPGAEVPKHTEAEAFALAVQGGGNGPLDNARAALGLAEQALANPSWPITRDGTALKAHAEALTAVRDALALNNEVQGAGMDLGKLRDLAQAATPGPWTGDRYDGTVKYDILGANGGTVIRGDNGNSEGGPYGIYRDEDERFILAANPATILALLDALAAQAPKPEAKGGPMADQDARFAIDGAIMFGREDVNRPPTDDHWLMEYWQIGRQLAALGETSAWDNVTAIPKPEVVPAGYKLVPIESWRAVNMGWAYLDAARAASPEKDWAFSHAGYEAMVAAAPTVAQSELHIGMSNNDQGVHISIMQQHADGSATLIFSQKCPEGDSFGRATLVPTVAQSEPAQPQAAVCATCNGSGVIGYPPDDYWPCPYCYPAQPQAAQGQPQADWKLMPPDADEAMMHAAQDVPQPRPYGAVYRAMFGAAPQSQARPTDDDLWDQTLRERDSYHEVADKLAEAIATYFDADIGEHSSNNCPWDQALQVIESTAPQPQVAQGAAAGSPLVEGVKAAWENYERFGAVCHFEGEPMVHASTLADLFDLTATDVTSAAPQPQAEDKRDAERLDFVIANKDLLLDWSRDRKWFVLERETLYPFINHPFDSARNAIDAAILKRSKP